MNKMELHYYHCATKGFDHCILFENEKEFIAGMNRIGICSVRLNQVKVIAFCLMDNHVHFILFGTREACLQWMGLYHKHTMMWQKNQRAERMIDEPWEYEAWPIRDAEDLKRKIAYVFRNPTMARMGCVPDGYPWSSANLVFHDNTRLTRSARKIGSMTDYECRNAFYTRIPLPGDWLVLPDGLIWPGCYTDSPQVEKLFSHPRNYLYYLNQNLEADINQEMYSKKISLPDRDIAKVALATAYQEFGTEDIESLDIRSRTQLGILVQKKTGASVKQLARIIHIPLDSLKTIFC